MTMLLKSAMPTTEAVTQINNEDTVNAPVSISYDCTSTDTTSSVGDGTV